MGSYAISELPDGTELLVVKAHRVQAERIHEILQPYQALRVQQRGRWWWLFATSFEVTGPAVIVRRLAAELDTWLADLQEGQQW